MINYSIYNITTKAYLLSLALLCILSQSCGSGDPSGAKNTPPTAEVPRGKLIVYDADDNGKESITAVDASTDNNSIIKWEWSKDGTIISTTQTLEKEFDVGTHSVLLTVWDNDNDSAEIEVTLIVIPKFSLEVNGPSFIIDENDLGIIETSFSGNTTINASNITFQWEFDNQIMSEDINYTVSLPIGHHTLTLHALDIYENILESETHSVVIYDSTHSDDFTFTHDNHKEADNLGTSLSLDKDTLVLGAHQISFSTYKFDNGYAQVYTRDLNGLWESKQTITASAPMLYSGFGYSVDVSGDWIAVGSEESNPGGSGRIYTYLRNGETWIETQIITPSSPSGYAMGNIVLLENNHLCTRYQTGNNNYNIPVYHFNGTNWQLIHEFTNKRRLHSLKGNLLCVSDDDKIEIYQLDESNVTKIDEIIHSSNTYGDVDFSDDFVFVGDYQDDKVYIYEKDISDIWNLTSSINASYTNIRGFGNYITFTNDLLFINYKESDSGDDISRLNIYQYINGKWENIRSYQQNNPEYGWAYARYVCTDDDYIYVGAPQRNLKGTESGTVHRYRNPKITPDLVPKTNN